MEKLKNPIRLLFIFVLFFAQNHAWSAPAAGFENFHSMLTASSILGEPVDVKVEADEFFKVPDQDILTVIWPTTVAGRIILFSKGTGVLYEPQKKLAISLKGLPQPTPEELVAKYQALAKAQQAQFNIKIVGPETVATLPGNRIESVKKPGVDGWVEKASLVVDSQYQQLLMSDTTYRGGAHSKVVTSQFHVNSPSEMQKFAFTLPSGTANFEVDFANHPLTEEAAKTKPGFANYFPSPAPAEYKAVSYEEVVGAQGSYSVVYRKAADYIAILGFYKCDFPLDMGIRIAAKTGRNGVLLRSEISSIYAYKNGDYLMMVVGNAPLDDILNTAAKLK